jgi:hypothetical protein
MLAYPTLRLARCATRLRRGPRRRRRDHVFYTHRRHVGIGELECVNCHGEIADTERPPERPLVRIDMDLCMDCHREHEETVDCNACHR